MTGIEALERGAAWTDLSSQARLRATGEDRARLIHAICSNDVEGLSPGQGTYAFFLSPQGRIQGDSHIFAERDHVLVVCERSARETLRSHIESYIIMDDVVLEDRTGKADVLGLAGPRAANLLSSLCQALPSAALHAADCGPFRTRRAPVAGRDGFWLEAPPAQAGALRAGLERLGAVRASERDCEVSRVRRRVPRFGPDFGPSCIPHETQLMSALSFTKGCYTGQEIVERVRSRGQVRRLLVSVEFDGPQIPADLRVQHGETKVGTLTSPTDGAGDERACGFAILRRSAAMPGTRVRVGPCPATVAELGAR